MKFIKTILLTTSLLFVQDLISATINVGSGGCTLKDAIRAANADNPRGNCNAGNGSDVIILQDGTNIELTSELPTISTAMTIKTVTDSAQAVISPESGLFKRVMKIANTSNVYLRNIELSGGHINSITSTNGGSGLLIINSQVDLYSVRIGGAFNENVIDTGTKIGAGLRIKDNSTVSIDESFFRNNKLVSDDILSAANNRGGDIAITDSTVIINNTQIDGCNFNSGAFGSGCLPSATKGAGIYLDNSELTLLNSSLVNHSNNDSSKGADIYAINDSNINAKNTTFYSIYGGRGGNRIFLDDSEMSLNNATLWGDSSYGGIETKNSTVYASNSIFYTRIATGETIGDFCKAFDSNNNSIAFNLQLDINNLAPFDYSIPGTDDSCGITQILPNADSFSIVYIPEYNGGNTITSRLITASSNFAINNGDSATCETHDQRGELRDATCDIGAFELTDVTDISIEMEKITPSPYYFGQLIEYEIDIVNNGPSAAYGIRVNFDTLGMNIDHFDASFCFDTANGFICNINSLNNGGNAVFKMFALNNSNSVFKIAATVDENLEYSLDPDTSNNTDDTNNGGVSVDASDLSITQLIITPGPYFIGQEITYEIEIENTGLDAATNIIVSNSLLGLSNRSYQNCDNPTSSSCTINFLGNSAMKTVNVSATITTEVIRNIGNVISDQFDPHIINNTTINQNHVETDSDLNVTMSLLTPAPHYPGDYFQYQISITNNGPDTATNIILTNFQGDNLVITDGDSTCMLLPCNIPTILDGETKNILLGGFVGFPGGFDVFHRVSVYSDQNDNNQSNNEDLIQTHVDHAADVETRTNLMTTGEYYSDQEVLFEIVVKNNGSTTASMVEILGNPTNLVITQVASTNCFILPCLLSNLEIGVNNQETIILHALILNQGNFSINASATALEHDDLQSNNHQSDGGVAILNPNDLIFKDDFE